MRSSLRAVREWLTRLWSTARSVRSDRDVQDELRLHLDLEAERLRRAGYSPTAARRAAVSRVGAVAPALETVRDRRDLPWLADLWRDVRYAVRRLRHDPAFACVAILSLGLGIGTNTAVFGVLDAVMLRSLPVARPQDLVFLEAVGSRTRGNGAPPYPCFERLRRETSVFTGMAAFTTDQLPIQIDGTSEQALGQIASGNYFDVLGVKPALGRLLTPDDERLSPASAVISYAYWQRRFGGDEHVLGRTIVFRGQSFTIVGVTPPHFAGLDPGQQVDLTLPITVEREYMADAGGWWLHAVARLRPDAPAARASTEIDAVFQSYMNAQGTDLSGLRREYFSHLQALPAARGMDTLRTRFGTPLSGLAVVSGLVLLIACANLGSLLLVRGTGRSREIAIRLAAGASRGRLVRQMLAETTVLFIFGAGVGIALAPAAISGLTGFFAVGRMPLHVDATLDWRLTAAAAGVALIAALSTGLWPALRAVGRDPRMAATDGRQLTASARTNAATRALVVVQIAMALVLVVTAVVFVKTIVNLRDVDLGFRQTRMLTMSVNPMLPDNVPADETTRFWTDVLSRVRAVAGANRASLSVMTPLSGRDSQSGIDVPGFEPQTADDRLIHLNHVSDGYFQTYGIPIVRGRGFTSDDERTRSRVIVVNETTAKAYFDGRNPIGVYVRFGSSDPYEIIGVAGNSKHASVREATPRFVFAPLWRPVRNLFPRLTLSVVLDRSSPEFTRLITDQVHAVRSVALVSDVVTLDDQIDATLVSERLVSTLALAFAALALGLAAIGIYGVLAHSVAGRRVEFGIRSALGASPGRLAGAVLGPLAIDVLLGTAIGLPLAILAVTLARTLLFGVQPGDAGPYLTSAAVLALVVVAAAARPLYRAWWTDPAATLRSE
jgi:predicted permease